MPSLPVARGRRIAALTLAGVATATAFALPYLPAFRRARFARMSVAQQLQVLTTRQDDPLFLEELGRKLNADRQFEQARTVLERAAGLDPDAAGIRDEWARAQMATGKVSDAYGQLKQFDGAHPDSPQAPLLLGKFHITQATYTPARDALETAVKRDPDNGEAWSLLAHVRIKMGQNGAALEALERALSLRPDQANDHLQKAVLLVSTDPNRAREAFQRALALAPEDPVCRREQALFFFRHGDSAAAETSVREALRRDPADPLAHLLLGRALLGQKRPDQAIVALTEAQRLAPHDPNPADELRRACRMAGDVAGARRWDRRFLQLRRGAESRRRLREATLTRPGDPILHRRYGTALAAIGEINGCAQQFALAARVRPDHPRALLAAARALNEQGYARPALSLARQALATSASNPEAFETLADIQVALGYLHEAGINYERMRDWRRDRVPLFRRKLQEAAARLARSDAPAERLLRQARSEHDPERAQVLLNEALRSDPAHTRALRHLLRLQFARGKRAEATATAQRLAQLSPEDGVAHALLAMLQLDAIGERPPGAEERQQIEAHLRSAEPDASVAATVLYARGWLSLRTNDPKQAIQELSLAARLDPNGVAVYRRLAEAKTAVGDTAGAAQAMAEFQRRSGAQQP